MKPLDPVNTEVTWVIGIVISVLGIIGTVLSNPQAVAAIVTIVEHPNIPAILSAVGVLAGIIALAIGKPKGTSA